MVLGKVIWYCFWVKTERNSSCVSKVGASSKRIAAASTMTICWISPWGGSTWEWDPSTEQYYLHTHLVEQPDLNWRNPELVRAMHDVLRFWLDRGVGGFRIDVVQGMLKDPELRDNPDIPGVPGPGGQHDIRKQIRE